jgi:hypothetical protein
VVANGFGKRGEDRRVDLGEPTGDHARGQRSAEPGLVISIGVIKAILQRLGQREVPGVAKRDQLSSRSFGHFVLNPYMARAAFGICLNAPLGEEKDFRTGGETAFRDFDADVAWIVKTAAGANLLSLQRDDIPPSRIDLRQTAGMAHEVVKKGEGNEASVYALAGAGEFDHAADQLRQLV